MCVDTTQLLRRIAEGDRTDVEKLFDHLYAELRALAASKFNGERPGHTLQPTALVNELYLRMIDQSRVNWRDRGHFLAIAATVMRRVLIDHSRSKRAEKRGGGVTPASLDEVLCIGDASDPAEMVALSDCLDRLANLNQRHASIVELKVFGGLTVAEMSEVLGVSPATVKNDWRAAPRVDRQPTRPSQSITEPVMPEIHAAESNVTTSRYDRACRLFLESLEVDAANRNQWLCTRAEGDESLLAQVESMFARTKGTWVPASRLQLAGRMARVLSSTSRYDSRPSAASLVFRTTKSLPRLPVAAWA